MVHRAPAFLRCMVRSRCYPGQQGVGACCRCPRCVVVTRCHRCSGNCTAQWSHAVVVPLHTRHSSPGGPCASLWVVVCCHASSCTRVVPTRSQGQHENNAITLLYTN